MPIPPPATRAGTSGFESSCCPLPRRRDSNGGGGLDQVPKQAETRPFFAGVHLYDPHAPYEPPEPYRGRFAGRLYDGEIALVDAEVGRLLALLEQRGLDTKTVVAVVGDHGEALGEHGELTHGLLLYEGSLHVPLLLAAPGVLPSGWVVDEPVGLADVAPTLAGLIGYPLVGMAQRTLDGRDLSATLRARREPQSADLYAETRYPTTFMRLEREIEKLDGAVAQDCRVEESTGESSPRRSLQDRINQLRTFIASVGDTET